MVVRASSSADQGVDRRGALGLLAAAAVLVANQPASQAAYGEAARVFGSEPTNKTGFIPYSGDGYAMLLPARWNPSKQREFPGTDLRYEDNTVGAINSATVIVQPASGGSISSYGSPEKFLAEHDWLLGKTSWSGESLSEGGFKPNTFAQSNIVDIQEASDKKGKLYYKYHVITRTADGTEGGKHQLIAAAVGNNKLYILKAQVGDKRWNTHGKDCQGMWNSFTVA
jgi:hypothetical protein